MKEHTPTPWESWDISDTYGRSHRKTRLFGVKGAHAVGRVEADSRRIAELDRAFIVLAVNSHDDLVAALQRIANMDRAAFVSEEPINVAYSALALLDPPPAATPAGAH